MILKTVLKSLARGKARFICAIVGVAAAVGAVTFVTSLSATNSAQAPYLAKEAVRPWSAWKIEGEFGFGRRRGGKPPAARSEARTERKAPARISKCDLKMELIGATIDCRPGGRALQGPPMRAVIARSPAQNPYESTKLIEGRWVDLNSSSCEVVCTRNTLKRFRGEALAKVGDTVKFVGGAGTMSAKIVGFLDDQKLPMGFPSVFANNAAFDGFAGEKKGSISLWRDNVDGPGVLTPSSERVVESFKGDEQRRMDYARPLMLAAAILTALALLVNSLLLSVEANRGSLAILRTVGLTRFGVVRFAFAESLLSTCVGALSGVLLAALALCAYVSLDPVAFPAGVAFNFRIMAIAFGSALVIAPVAVLFALKSFLSVRALDASSIRPRSRRLGMAVAFAFGFGAFVAVEIWGASLMRGFVPSPEWPDAIVSLLPGGASSFDIEKLRGIKGVKRISELLPLQVDLKDGASAKTAKSSKGGEYRPNALFLAAEWLPEFNFVEGDHSSAAKALREGDGCVISLMMSRARSLHKGDELKVLAGGRGPKTEVSLPIVGVVDVNWHMVTSRGLVRGMNGASGMTDGPVFVSFDTVESLDPRPAAHVRMTHLWVEYEKDFLNKNGVFGAARIIEREISSRLGGSNDFTVRLHARDEIADGTLAHGSDLIGQAARVPFVFLAILAIGFIAMLVAEADAGKNEYAVLRAVGATRSQLVARLAAAALKTAAWGIVIALPFGALAGWLFAIKTAAVWPGMPHYFVVPWRIIAEGALGAVLFAIIVAIPTAMSIIKRATKR